MLSKNTLIVRYIQHLCMHFQHLCIHFFCNFWNKLISLVHNVMLCSKHNAVRAFNNILALLQKRMIIQFIHSYSVLNSSNVPCFIFLFVFLMQLFSPIQDIISSCTPDQTKTPAIWRMWTKVRQPMAEPKLISLKDVSLTIHTNIHSTYAEICWKKNCKLISWLKNVYVLYLNDQCN